MEIKEMLWIASAGGRWCGRQPVFGRIQWLREWLAVAGCGWLWLAVAG